MFHHRRGISFGDDIHANSLSPYLKELEPKAYGIDSGATHKRITGLECAGIITRVGTEAAAQGNEVGHRVTSLLRQSSFASRAIVEWTSTAHIPADLGFEEAASTPVAFLTAYFSLIEISRLRRDQSVLIHAAAGAIGQASILIAYHLEAQVYVTADTPEERQFVMQKHSLPASRVFSSQNKSFSAATLAATKGHGVDFVLKPHIGPILQKSFNLLATVGHFIEIGKRDLEANNNVEMKPFARSISFSFIDLPSLQEHRGSDLHHSLSERMRLI